MQELVEGGARELQPYQQRQPDQARPHQPLRRLALGAI